MCFFYVACVREIDEGHLWCGGVWWLVFGGLGVQVTRAIVPVMNTVAIALAVFFVFGIMAVQLLGGRTGFCTDIHVSEKQNCTGIDPITNGTRLWRQRQLTYGWIGNAPRFVISMRLWWFGRFGGGGWQFAMRDETTRAFG